MTPDKDSTDHLLTNGTSSSYCKKEKVINFSLFPSFDEDAMFKFKSRFWPENIILINDIW